MAMDIVFVWPFSVLLLVLKDCFSNAADLILLNPMKFATTRNVFYRKHYKTIKQASRHEKITVIVFLEE